MSHNSLSGDAHLAWKVGRKITREEAEVCHRQEATLAPCVCRDVGWLTGGLLE